MIIPPGYRVHWFQLLADLTKAGFSLTQVAREIQVETKRVYGWRYGAHPRHADGERLIELYLALTGYPRERLPLISEHDHRA